MEKYTNRSSLKSNHNRSLLQGSGPGNSIVPGLTQDVANNASSAIASFAKKADMLGEQSAKIMAKEKAQEDTAAWVKKLEEKKNIEKMLENSKGMDLVKSNIPSTTPLPTVTTVHPFPDGSDLIVDGAELDPVTPKISKEEANIVNLIKDKAQVSKLDNIPSKSTDVLTQELNDINDELDYYVERSVVTPGFNIYDYTRQQEQQALFKQHLGNKFDTIVNASYEKFKDDPDAFQEVTNKFINKLSDGLPSQIVGDFMVKASAKYDTLYTKTIQNRKDKDLEVLTAGQKTNIDSNVISGTKLARDGGDWSENFNTIDDSLKILARKGVIDPDKYMELYRDHKKVFVGEALTGNFNRIVDTGDFEAAREEINKFKGSLAHIDDESLQEYEERTGLFKQSEVDKIVSSMERKLIGAKTKAEKDELIVTKKDNKLAKDAKKLLWDGIMPSNLDAYRKIAVKNDNLDDYNMDVTVMNYVQTLDGATIDQQSIYIEQFRAKKLTGLSPEQVKINKVIVANFKKNKALADKDPNQAAIQNGLFEDISTMQYEDGSFDNKKLFQELGNRVQEQDELEVQFSNVGKTLLSERELEILGSSLNVFNSAETVQGIYEAVGREKAVEIFKTVYPKTVNGVIYNSVLADTKPQVAKKSIIGMQMIQNGGKLEAEDQSDFNDYMKEDTVIRGLGPSAKGIRESIEGYYHQMPIKNIDEAVQKVTNGIDNDIIVYKEGLTYDDVVDNMESFGNDRGKIVAFKQRLSAEPTIGYVDLRDHIDEFQLITTGVRKYGFKHKKTGRVLTDVTNKFIEFTFREND